MSIFNCDYVPAYRRRTFAGGQPLKKGIITLYRTGAGTTVGGEIIDGKSTLPRDRGPTPVKYRVEIVAFRPSGTKEFDSDLRRKLMSKCSFCQRNTTRNRN